MKNITCTDRFLRIFFAVGLAQLGYFWLGSPWNWLAYAAAAIMIATALSRYCPVYGLLGRKPINATRNPRGLFVGFAAILLATLLAGGSYASIFFSRKFFLEDFNAMNHFYKQTLFLTGKNQRSEAVANLNGLKPAFAAFKSKYTTFRPYNLKGDQQLVTDFTTVSKILSDVEPLVTSGDLHQAHLDLEKIRPIWQDVFKRNGFSMLAVALVDFHDAMETILDAANAKNVAKITELYPAVSDKLKLIEAEANDDEIKAIRSALDDVLSTAQTGEPGNLPEKANTLKSNFVKVYLARG
jgi:Protein of unknown function (DUF2892)